MGVLILEVNSDEDSMDSKKYPPSFTAPIPYPEKKKKTDWRSLYVMGGLVFLSTVQVSGLMTSLWPYLQQMDSTTDEKFLGYVQSTRSLGSILIAPLAGFVSSKIKMIKLPLFVANVISFFALLLYVSIELFPDNRKYVLMIVEFLFGIKIGIMHLSRAHSAMASNEDDRAKAICITTVAPLVGLTLGPLFQLAFTTLGYPGVNFLFGTHLNMYTLPAFVGIIGSVISVILLITLFDDPYKRFMIAASDSGPKMAINVRAVGLCFLTKIVIGLMTSSRQSINSPYQMTVFGWSSATFIVWHSVVAASLGIIGIAWHTIYIFCKKIVKTFSAKSAVIIGLSFSVAFYAVTFPWPFIGRTIKYEDVANETTASESRRVLHNGGCDLSYEWCGTTAAVNPILYNVAEVVLLGIGTPLLMINLDVIFSKLLRDKKQATMQGIFMTVGDVVTLGCPLITTLVYKDSGPTYIWIFDFAVALLCALLWLGVYNRITRPVLKGKH